jgi:GNAT superfamily N-acetyltransferase
MENRAETNAGASSAEFTIRRADAADIVAMSGLLSELFAIETDFQIDRNKQCAALELLLDSMEVCLLVAECEGAVRGMVTVQLLISTAEGGYSGLLEDLVVTADYRGRGIGKALLAAAIDWTRQQGASRLQLLADSRNAPALEFYAAQNWIRTSMVALRAP